MHPRIFGLSLNDQGDITIEWFDDDERDLNGVTTHFTTITRKAQEEWEQVAYWSKELHTDLYELLDVYIRYRNGML